MPNDQERIKELILTLSDLKKDQDDIANDIKTVQGELCDLMSSNEIKTYDFETGPYEVKATYVSTTKTKVDEVSLKKAIGARTFNTLTTRKIDNGLLEKAIIDGKIDARIVSQSTAIVKSAPYVRITERVHNSEF